MFLGTLPKETRQIIYEIVSKWETDSVYVGCCGNFTIERSIAPLGKKLHSCDVSMYSSALGWFYSGQPVKITFNEEWSERFGYFLDYFKTDVDKVATMLIASRMFMNMNLHASNIYYERMHDEYRFQFDSLHANLAEKLEKNTFRLDSYACEDVNTWIDRVPEGAGFITFPPFWDTGYLKMYKNLEEVFHYDPPVYKFFTDDVKQKYIEKTFSKTKFITGFDFKLEGKEQNLTGLVQNTNRSKPIYMYANEFSLKVSLPHQTLEPLMAERLGPEDDIQGPLRFIRLTHGQFSLLRSEYLNKKIAPGMESFALGLMAGDKLVGVLGFSTASTLTQWDHYVPTPTIYLLSDFPVAGTKYKRLSKLVVMSVLSHEAKVVIQNIAGRFYRSIVTTPFTEKDVSMKYRKIFKVLNRSEMKKGDPGYIEGSHRVNYGEILGKWSLEETFEMWKREYA